MTARLLHRVNGSLLAALLIGSAWAFPRLPERIPAHFDAAGEVTRWAEPSAVTWFLLPLIAVATVALNYGLARLLPRRPQLFNFPGKPQLLALPAERRGPVIARMQECLYALSVPVVALFGYLQWTSYRAAHGADSGELVLGVHLLGFVAVPLVLVLWLPRVQRELDRQRTAHPEGTS